jgi:hypothetical protein
MLAVAILFAPALLGFVLLASSLEVRVLREPGVARRRAPPPPAAATDPPKQPA